MRRTGGWQRRWQDLRGSRHSILVSVFVSADFVMIQVANRWQLWPMTSQYIESHGWRWHDHDAFFATGQGETYLLLEGSMVNRQLKSVYDRVHERRESQGGMEGQTEWGRRVDDAVQVVWSDGCRWLDRPSVEREGV